jgi:arylsulfatase
VDVEVAHAAGDAGVLLAHGRQVGGHSLFIEAGRLRCAYDAYGDLHEVDGGALAPGPHTVRLAAAGRPHVRLALRLLVDGIEVGRLDGLAMLLGLAPLEGIDVGIDRRGPVHWGVYERHGAFPYRGDLQSVTYTPGALAPYDPVALASATREATRVVE